MSLSPSDLLFLVKDFGEQLTLRKVTKTGSYDTSSGSVSGSETKDYPFTGYFYNLAEGVFDSNQTRKGSRACVIPAKGLSVVPDDEDQIKGYDETVNIVAVKTIRSKGQPVCYLCEISE
jgi:hypothetical protein